MLNVKINVHHVIRVLNVKIYVHHVILVLINVCILVLVQHDLDGFGVYYLRVYFDKWVKNGVKLPD